MIVCVHKQDFSNFSQTAVFPKEVFFKYVLMHSFLDKNEQACCKQVCTSNVLRWRFTFSFLHNEHKSLACAVLVKKVCVHDYVVYCTR